MQGVVTIQVAEIAALRGEVADLREHLDRNPRNSSMRPSAELFTKPPSPSRAERRVAAKKQGKQPGAPDKHLAQRADPDLVVTHARMACTSCGSGLEGAEVVGTESRQVVFDLPEIHPYVIQHRAQRRRGGCGATTKATSLAVATAPACCGPGVRALAAYLAVHQDLGPEPTAMALRTWCRCTSGAESWCRVRRACAVGLKDNVGEAGEVLARRFINAIEPLGSGQLSRTSRHPALLVLVRGCSSLGCPRAATVRIGKLTGGSDR